MGREHIHFVTGRLAEETVRHVVGGLAASDDFDYSVGVLGITVAALMTTEWVSKRIHVPEGATRVMLPGYCLGDLGVVEQAVGVPVVRGPKDVRDLAGGLREAAPPAGYGAYDIQIIAEINHAPRWDPAALNVEALRLARGGADMIDLGCTPGETWIGAGDAARRIVDQGLAVSIDSFNPAEIEEAIRGGACLVLSVNRENAERAADWGCEVVAIPDQPGSLAGLEETAAFLRDRNVPFRLDPILEPIGFGFTASLERYMAARRKWPDAEMMMGVGNVTELTDVDSAGLNLLLLAVCQELGVRSVLTTQVIPWTRTAVQECDVARRLVKYAVGRRALPKHVDPRLVMLRDPRVHEQGNELLDRLARSIKDANFRIFAESGRIHVLTRGFHDADEDPFALLDRLERNFPERLSASHAFYLGYEMAKAVTALTLGKSYRQDEALEWGFLTRPERSHQAGRGKGAAE